MFAFTSVGWAIFRCGSLSQLGNWFRALGHWEIAHPLSWLKPTFWVVFHALPLLALQVATWKERDEAENAAWPWPVRGLAYAIMLVAVASSAAGEVQFIYFQF
jgi:hypothetical protein